MFWQRNYSNDITFNRPIKKYQFGKIFTNVWNKAATPKNISSGFEATEIYPFNPNRIPGEAYAPSNLSHQPIFRAQVYDEDHIDVISKSSSSKVNPNFPAPKTKGKKKEETIKKKCHQFGRGLQFSIR